MLRSIKDSEIKLDAAVRELYLRYRKWGWEAKMALRVAKEHIRDRRCPQP